MIDLEELGFDPASAMILPGYSPHKAYRDRNGNACLVCQARKTGSTGVIVNESGLDMLKNEPGRKFVRLQNLQNGFEALVPLERLPAKQMVQGIYGRFCFYDRRDFDVDDYEEPFPPFAVTPINF